jgi:anti-sigma factor RsiW
MNRELWFEQLEAYLDDELNPEQRTAFEAATVADPGLQAELEARRAFGEAAREALDAEFPPDLEDLAAQALRTGYRKAPRRPVRRWAALAVAATLAAAVLIPGLLRNFDEAAGPRFDTRKSGQVVAVRFGEQPGHAIRLEVGCFDQNLGECQ